MQHKRMSGVTMPTGPITILVLSAMCLAYIFAAHDNIFSTGNIANTLRRGSQIQLRNNTSWKPPEPLSYDKAASYAEMMVEQKRRRALIDRACIVNNRSRTLDLEKGDRTKVFESVGHLLVDDKYKLLFGFIPKVGCTTWKRVIAALRRSHPGDFDQTKTLRDFEGNLTEITYRLENYRKVLFVREPITRMLSAYLSKLRTFGGTHRIWERYIGGRIVKTYRGYIHSQRFKDVEDKPFMNITLSEFIRFIVDVGPDIAMDELNDHWLPFHVVSNPCQIRYDFIGHYEDLATEAPFLLRWLGIDTVVEFPEVHPSHASDSLVTEYAQVPLGLLKTLYDYYDFDYKAFGYRKNQTMSYLLRGIFEDFDAD